MPLFAKKYFQTRSNLRNSIGQFIHCAGMIPAQVITSIFLKVSKQTQKNTCIFLDRSYNISKSLFNVLLTSYYLYLSVLKNYPEKITYVSRYLFINFMAKPCASCWSTKLNKPEKNFLDINNRISNLKWLK